MDDTAGVIDEHYHMVCAGRGYHGQLEQDGFTISACISIQDARLVAAAPDLLKASEGLLEAISGIPGIEEARKAMIEAHRKAYGDPR